MAAKKTATKKAAQAKPETFNVPRSPVELAAAITRRVKRSPKYWEQVQTAMQAAEAGLSWRAKQSEPRQVAH